MPINGNKYAEAATCKKNTVVMETCMVYRGHKTHRHAYVPVRHASHSVVGLEASE